MNNKLDNTVLSIILIKMWPYIITFNLLHLIIIINGPIFSILLFNINILKKIFLNNTFYLLLTFCYYFKVDNIKVKRNIYEGKVM